jgi:hypothetical protein
MPDPLDCYRRTPAEVRRMTETQFQAHADQTRAALQALAPEAAAILTAGDQFITALAAVSMAGTLAHYMETQHGH